MCAEIEGKREVLLAIAGEDTVVVFATLINMAELGSNGCGYRTRVNARVVKGLILRFE